MKNLSSLLAIDGGEVKSTDVEGQVIGLGIVFGSPSQPDQSQKRDFFTDESYISRKSTVTVPLYYEHGAGLIEEEVGEAVLTKAKDGWAATAQIDTTTELGKKVYEAVKDKPHSFSTGAMQHLVKRIPQENNTNFLKKWAVGELSLTQWPAERRAVVQAVKSIEGDVAYESIDGPDTMIAIYDEAGLKLWDLADNKEIPAFEDIPTAKSIEIKTAYGSKTYNLSLYDEKSGISSEITMYQYGGEADLISTLQNVINAASLGMKSKTPEEKDFETRVTEIVKQQLQTSVNNNSELTSQLKKQEEEITELKSTLLARDEALAKYEDEARLEILAGAKETITKYKGI